MSRSILSIKLKIIVTFVAAFVVVVGLLATTGYIMQMLESRVVILEEVSKLEERVQDLRRCEKNLFLYKDQECGQRAVSLIEDIRQILAANQQSFENAFSRERMQTFRTDLKSYEQVMTHYRPKYAGAGDVSVTEVEAEQNGIRDIGTRLLMFVESIAKQKRGNIRRSIQVVNNLQLAEALLVGIGLLIFGGLVLTKVVHPLKLLQDHAYRIGKGNFNEIESPPHEHEIADVYKAFNRMTHDLTKREQDLLQSRHLASLGTLLAGVAHELNNPLSNIRSTCQILMEDDGNLDEEFIRESRMTIIEEVDKAATIVRDLLEFSRGKEAIKSSCNLKKLVNRTLSLLHGKIPPEIELVVSVDETRQIYADEQAILQALLNVISNAVDAIKGEGKIIIEAKNGQDGMLDLVITDSGEGIAAEDFNRIFDPFFSTKDVGKGIGLGLFITHQIIERNFGRVSIQSVPGEGTSVVLRMPSEERSA
ncbi:ATP-binding protein [Thermodesulfobacteriota bacterium]